MAAGLADQSAGAGLTATWVAEMDLIEDAAELDGSEAGVLQVLAEFLCAVAEGECVT